MEVKDVGTNQPGNLEYYIYSADLKKSAMKINKILHNYDRSTNNERELKIVKMAQNICDNHQYYQTFHRLKLLEEYVESNTKLIQMQVNEERLKELIVFEETALNSCDFKHLPSIILTDIEAIRHDFAECKYNVKINWQTDKNLISNNRHDEDIQFVVEYSSAEAETDIEDEKKQEDVNPPCWKKIPLLNMETLCDNQFSAELKDYFVFGTQYNVRITTKIKNVLLFNVQSNIKTIELEQQSIPLKVHSWNSTAQIDDKYPPQNLLDSKPFYIADQGTDAWVIFDTEEVNALYIPTKVTVRGANTGSMKDFNLWVGNAQQDKWLKCHETQLTMQDHKEYQSFELNYIDTNHTVKSNHYKQYKLEMLNNYG
eukprot:483583_1